MKLSKETFAILQNYASINQSILFEEGNFLRTISPTESIFAKAKVTEEFPMDAAVYNLPKLLGILSIDKENSELNFLENYLEISQGKSKVKYAYCNADLIKAPPKGQDIKIKNPEIGFELQEDVLQNLLKAMAILNFSEIAIRGENGVLSVETLSTKNDSSDSYSTEIGETDQNFFVVFDADKLQLIPDDYKIQISSRGISQFSSDTVSYWIAINANKSRFE